MASDPGVAFSTEREHFAQFPAVEQLRSQNPAGEQSVDELRAAVTGLQQIVCELLLTNQVLRMALDLQFAHDRATLVHDADAGLF